MNEDRTPEGQSENPDGDPDENSDDALDDL